MKTFAAIAVLLITPLLGQSPSNQGAGEPPINAGRVAQMVGTEVTWTWAASSHDLTIVPDMSVFPIGMTAVTDGGDIVFTLKANTPGLFTVRITLDAQIPLADNWTGPPIKAQQTAMFEWIVYDGNASLFLNGFGDVLLPEPDPN